MTCAHLEIDEVTITVYRYVTYFLRPSI